MSIAGPSGWGKATLLRLIAGLDALLIDAQEIRETSHEQGYSFQQPTLFPWARVFDNVATGLRAWGVYEAQKHRVKDYIQMI